MPEILKFKKKTKTATAWSSKVLEYLCLQINVLSKKKKHSVVYNQNMIEWNVWICKGVKMFEQIQIKKII